MFTKKYRLLWAIALLGIVVIFMLYPKGKLLKSRRSSINFYQDGNLMWLIDTTEKNRDYSHKTISEIKVTSPNVIHYSYENYITYVNSHKEYQYDNWRVPTRKELLQLEQKDSFLLRLLASKEQKKSQICIDTEIFYDHKIRHVNEYWTNETCSSDVKDGYITVDFNALRFDPKSYAKASPAWGITYGCTVKYGKYNLRLVRDVK